MTPLPKLLYATRTFYKYILPHLGYDICTDQKIISEICRIIDPINTGLPESLGAVISRDSTWSNSVPFHVIRPLTESNKTIVLEDLCHSRAQTILSYNKPIKVFWSGGIDSTLVLSHILYHSNSSSDITVCCTAQSFKENSDYQNFLNNFSVKIERLEYSWKTLNSSDCIVVTGCSADRLLASLSEKFFLANVDWLNGLWSDFLLKSGMSMENVDYCLNKIPAHVVTLLDLCWWMNQNFRIQPTLLRDHWDNNLENPLSHTISFFDHSSFDHWSAQNRQQIIVDGRWNSYKRQYREEIYKIWPDQNFLENKNKIYNMSYRSYCFKKKNFHNQNYMLMYLDQDGIAKTYVPVQSPMIDLEQITQDLVNLANE